MKFAMLYGPFCLGGGGRGFRLSDLWTDNRGLTGSELSYFQMCRHLAALGHDVCAYTFFQDQRLPASFDGFGVRQFDRFLSEGSGWDAVCSWNEPGLLQMAEPSAVRLCNLQINSFTHCMPGFDDHVDVWTSPSESHRQMILSGPKVVGTDHLMQNCSYVANPAKWKVLTNGCDPDAYDLGAKVPGRVVYASSPDRGLHWLLQEWPKIRRAVPHAELRVFYRLKPWIDNMLSNAGCRDASDLEQIVRAHYMREFLGRVASRSDLGIQIVDSVSRKRMDREMSEAQVLAYPCDPVNWTEGFSVTIMEACAAGTMPVTCAADALPEIYGECVPMVSRPVKDHIGRFTELVVRGLTDDEFRRSTTEASRRLSLRYRWSDLAKRLEAIIKDAQEVKR